MSWLRCDCTAPMRNSTDGIATVSEYGLLPVGMSLALEKVNSMAPGMLAGAGASVVALFMWNSA